MQVGAAVGHVSLATAQVAGICTENAHAEEVAQRLEQDKGAASRVIILDVVEVARGASAPAAPDVEHVPAELVHVSDEEFDVLQRKYAEVKQRCDENGLPAPNVPLNPEQRALCRKALVVLRLMKRLRDRGLSRQVYSEEVAKLHQMLLLVIGAAGTGKTLMLKTLLRIAEAEGVGSILFAAHTGVAASLVEFGATLCSLLSLRRTDPNREGECPDPGSNAREQFERLAGPSYFVVMIAIDEVSFLNPPFLHHINVRLQRLLDCSLPFGGLLVLAMGDFHQLSPVSSASLMTELVRDTVLVVPGRRRGKRARKVVGASERGISLFKRFERHLLVRQMRASQDAKHMAFLDQLRDTSSLEPVSRELLESLPGLSSEDMADPEWVFAPVAVLSQEERNAVNMLKALQYARYTNVPLVRWRLPLTHRSGEWLDREELEDLRKHESGLWGVFVKGAPTLLCENMSVGRGLCNGTAGVLHSLTLAKGDSLEQAELQVQNGVEVLTLHSPPTTVNFLPDLRLVEKARLIADGLSLSADEAVIALRVSKQVKAVDLQSVHSATEGAPREVSVWRHPLELAMSLTDYKVQGRTMKHLVLSLSVRPFKPHMLLEKLYVLLSRVERSSSLRVIDSSFATLEHLLKLRHPPELYIWERAYDESGKWDHVLAQSAALQLKELMEKKKAAVAVGRKQVRQDAARKATGGKVLALQPKGAPGVHAQGRPDQSNRNSANSCHIDAALSLWEAAVSHTRSVHGVSTVLPGIANDAESALGRALSAWYAAREEVVVGVTPLVSAVRTLHRARDSVRQEVLIANGEHDPRGMVRMGAADENVNLFLRAVNRRGEGAPETLAVGQRKSCGCGDARVSLRRRGLPVSTLAVAEAGADVLAAFTRAHLTPGELVTCDQCGITSQTVPAFAESQRGLWVERGCVGFPWLLLIQLTDSLPGSSPFSLRADEVHTLVVDGLTVRLSLLGVLLYRGAHFWSRVRRASSWVQYDGLENNGIGVAIAAPTGNPLSDQGARVVAVLYGKEA